MRHLTVRDLPEEVADALTSEKKRRGLSLNKTVIALLAQALGLSGQRRTNGLEKHAGTWSEEELARFERDVEVFEQIDEEPWR